ncbi:MAG: nucleotidyltransferase family protein [Candidatus Saccharimonadales bacterium]
MTTRDLELPINITELRHILKKHGVVSASVFGSFARGEAGPDSDLDLLVTQTPESSLFDLGGLQYELEETLNRRVDIATKLNPRFEPYITPDLIEIL